MRLTHVREAYRDSMGQFAHLDRPLQLLGTLLQLVLVAALAAHGERLGHLHDLLAARRREAQRQLEAGRRDQC